MIILFDLRQDPDLLRRVHVLLHSLNNIKDHAYEKHLFSTTNEFNISES